MRVEALYFKTVEILAWIILIAGFILASVGTIIPGLPGSVFIVLGVIVHKLILPQLYSWWVVVAIAVIAIFSWIVDFVASAMGAKFGGATKYGLIGAAVGGLFGLFLGLPGLILGPFLGAITGDLYGKRTSVAQLMKSGTGAAAGFILSLIARFVLLLAMTIIMVVAIVV